MQQLLQYVTDQKIPEVARIQELIPTIEKRAKISLNIHLGKAIPTLIQTKTFSNYKYYGELNEMGQAHGRGIKIFSYGDIEIEYYENGRWSTGNYIIIHSDYWFKVGERYMKDGKRWERGTWYHKNGKEEQYDE